MTTASTSDSIAELVSLTGRTAVVTGGGQGLGLAIARRLAEAGSNIVLVDIDERVVGAAEGLAGTFGVGALGVLASVTDPEAMASVAALAEESWGGLHVWVNNAGIYPAKDAVDLPLSEWGAVLDVNLSGAFLGCKVAALVMREHLDRPGRVIVNLSSIAGFKARPHLPAYTAAKHGVIGLTKSMALELGPLGVRVLAVAPSLVETPGIRARRVDANGEIDPAVAEIERQLEAAVPLRRLGREDDVARAVLYCASDLSDFLSGAVLPIDGGILAT